MRCHCKGFAAHPCTCLGLLQSPRPPFTSGTMRWPRAVRSVCVCVCVCAPPVPEPVSGWHLQPISTRRKEQRALASFSFNRKCQLTTRWHNFGAMLDIATCLSSDWDTPCFLRGQIGWAIAGASLGPIEPAPRSGGSR